jgi:hypothetical protein
MPKMTPQEAAQKWAQRTTAAVPEYTTGIGRVTESPTEKAAAAADKMLAKIMESIQSGRWAAGLRKVSLTDWKDAATTKGAPRIAAGVQGAISKQANYYTELWPFLTTLQAEIAAMPNLTLEDSIARAAHYMRQMNAFKNQRS